MLSDMKSIKRGTIRALLCLLGSPLLLLLFLVTTILRLRFTYLDARRIGHFAFDLGHLITKKNSGVFRNTTILLFLRGPVCNTYLEQTARNAFITHRFFEIPYYFFEFFPGCSQLILKPQREITGSRDVKGVFPRNPCPISFGTTEQSRGERYLRSIGIQSDQHWVCLCVRDSSYLSAVDADRDWSYHNFRDSDIELFSHAAQYLKSLGLKVFRMGKCVSKPITFGDSDIIDYACSAERSDFLDVWLIANSKFCISTNLGIDAITLLFKTPLLIVNALPLADMQTYHHSIFVPKHLQWNTSGKHLTLNEYIDANGSETNYYRDHGITIRDLQPEEICAATEEMYSRLNDSWTESDHDRTMQQFFWKSMMQDKLYAYRNDWIHPEARIGRDFLKSIS